MIMDQLNPHSSNSRAGTTKVVTSRHHPAALEPADTLDHGEGTLDHIRLVGRDTWRNSFLTTFIIAGEPLLQPAKAAATGNRSSNQGWRLVTL